MEVGWRVEGIIVDSVWKGSIGNDHEWGSLEEIKKAKKKPNMNKEIEDVRGNIR